MSDLIFTFEDGSEYLCHYGVLGMKWGVRKQEKRSNRVKKYNSKLKNNNMPLRKEQRLINRRDISQELIKPGSSSASSKTTRNWKRGNYGIAAVTGSTALASLSDATYLGLSSATYFKLASIITASAPMLTATATTLGAAAVGSVLVGGVTGVAAVKAARRGLHLRDSELLKERQGK